MVQKLALAVALAVGIGQPAHAAIIDFEELSGGSQGSSLTTQGFVFSSTHNFWLNSSGANGTKTLSEYEGATVTVSAVGGGLFSLTSLDYADIFNIGEGFHQVAFVFNTASGVISTTRATDWPAGMQAETFNIAGISSFSYVSTSEFPGEGAIQLDNLVLTLDTAAAVPEPATWAMMFAGFGIVGYSMRRRSTRVAFT